MDRGRVEQALAVDRPQRQAPRQRPERARGDHGEQGRERPDGHERAQERVEAGALRDALEVVEEPERPARGEPGEQQHRPGDGIGAAEEPVAGARQRKQKREHRQPGARVPGGQQRQGQGQHQERQAIGGRGRESEREHGEKSENRGEQEKEPDASARPLRRFVVHPRWYSWSGATPVTPSWRSRIPSTAAVAAESVVRHGIESRSAAERMAASSKRDSLPSGVLITS